MPLKEANVPQIIDQAFPFWMCFFKPFLESDSEKHFKNKLAEPAMHKL